MTYLLAHVKLKYGAENFRDFNSLVTELLPAQEAATGWKLVYRLHAQTGRLWDVWHLWELRDQDHLAAGRAAMRDSPELGKMLKRLSTYVASEKIRVAESIPADY